MSVLARAFPGWDEAPELTPDECGERLPFQYPPPSRPMPEAGMTAGWWREMYEGWYG